MEKLPCKDAYKIFLKAQAENWDQTPNLSMTQIFSIAQQGLETLQDFYARGFLHCDLKPDNMVYDASNDRLVIFDLGTGQTTEKLIPAFTIHNTWFYQAPELCFGYETYGLSVDMWSFGAILFEFYTGKVLIPSNPIGCKPRQCIIADHLRVMAQNLGAFSRQMSELAHPALKTLFVRTSNTSEVSCPCLDQEVKSTMAKLTEICMPYPDMPVWQARIRHAAKLRLADPSEADRMIQLLEPMLCYLLESRINPTDALELLSTLRPRQESVLQMPASVNNHPCEFSRDFARVQETKSNRLIDPSVLDESQKRTRNRRVCTLL
jgi:serine/threonine protein kinase